MFTLQPSLADDSLLAELAGARAFHRFCTPRLSSFRSADHDRLVERARFHLRSARAQRLATSVGEVQTYVLDPKDRCEASALLVHGWTAEAAFMSAFADYLCRRGVRSVLLDLPAHGQSAGEQTSLIDCGHAVQEVANAMGPIRFAIGHSIGGLALLLAGEGRHPMPSPLCIEAYVLVAIPDRFADVTRRFGNEQNLSPAALQAFERRLERLAHRKIADFTGSNFLKVTGRPTLLVHARDDQEVPFEDAERLLASVSCAELRRFDGLGHRMILSAPPVVRAAADFLGGFR